MQSVSWHIRIRSDKPLYSSYLILKHLHIILRYSKSSPLCQCHNRKLSPYFKIILNLLQIPIISLHPWSNAVPAQSSVRCRLCGAAVGLLSRFPEWEVNSRAVDPRAGGGEPSPNSRGLNSKADSKRPPLVSSLGEVTALAAQGQAALPVDPPEPSQRG